MVRFSELPATSTLSGTEQIALVQGGILKRVNANLLTVSPLTALRASGTSYDVHHYGAVGDGVANDTSSIEAAVAAAAAAGGGTVLLRPGRTYLVRRFEPTNNGPAIRLRARISLNGQGATIRLDDNCSFSGGSDYLLTGTGNTAQVTADVARGASTLAVDNVGNIAVGDEVAVRLGDNQWDAIEVRTFLRASVTGINVAAKTVTLDRPVPNAEAVSGITNPNNKRILRLDKNRLLDNVAVRNVSLVNPATGAANAEAGIYVGYARNLLIENVQAENPGAGLAIVHYSDSVVVRNCGVTKSDAQNGQVSKGRVINMWNNRNVLVDTVYGARFAGAWAFIESYCKSIVFRNCLIDDTHLSPLTASETILTVGQGSQCVFENLRVEGRGGRVLHDDGSTSSVVKFRDLTIDTSVAIKGGLNPGQMEGMVQLRDLGPSGALTAFNVDRARWVERTVRLVDGMYTDIFLNPGLNLGVEIYASSEITASTHLDGIYVGGSSGNGFQVNPPPSAGSTVRALTSYGTDYAVINDFAGIKVLIVTKPSNVTAADGFLRIRQLVVPVDGAAIAVQSTAAALGDVVNSAYLAAKTEGAVAPAVNVQSFTANGTWNKPPDARFVLVKLTGGGGSGGAGTTQTNTTTASPGGGGGGGGAFADSLFRAELLPDTIAVTVGAAGPSRTSGSGVTGTTTAFGNLLRANGGTGGNGSGAGGAGGTIGTANGGGGSTTSATANSPTASAQNGQGASGGGAGGSNSTGTPTGRTGGAGGTLNQSGQAGGAGGTTPGTGTGDGGDGQPGADGAISTMPGAGGGGGGSGNSGNGGRGGNGGYPGGGGGGGGGTRTSGTPGASGAGGGGQCVVVSW